MKKIHLLKTLLFSYMALVLMISCQKTSDTVTPDNSGNSTDVRDSAYYYSLLYYYWNKNLPDYSKANSLNFDKLIPNDETVFKPHSFANVDSIMSGQTGIRLYSEIRPNGSHADRYSFAYPQTLWESTSSGSNLGFGFSRAYISESDMRIEFVFRNSAFGKADIKRGWKIVSVNGIAATYSNETALSNAISNNNSAKFVFQKQDGSQQTFTVAKTSYTADFILKDTVVTTGNSRIGYIALYSFLGDNDGQATQLGLDKAVANLKSSGITDLVVDLRYNGGGYVSVSEYFANLLAPASAKGKLMYSYQYNDLLNQYFNSNNYPTQINFNSSATNFNLSRIVFITSEQTASASELLINNLKPYLNVKLVGSRTYGKPVGFPSILIEMSQTDKSQNYYVFPISFKTLNANKETDYFEGITVDAEQPDDITHDWADIQEASFREAVKYLTTGTFLKTGSNIANKEIAQRKYLNKDTKNETVSEVSEMIDNRKLPRLPK